MPTAIKPVMREFEGIYRQQMPLLIEAGLKPATIEDVMQLRLEPRISFDKYYDTSTGIAYAGNNEDKFKILPYSEELASINPETELYLGGIKLTPDQYKLIQAQELTRKEAIFNKRLTEKQVLEHTAWLAAVNNNRELLSKYAEEVFKLVQDKFEEKEAMGFYIRNPQSVSNLRALLLYDLDDWSGASGNYGLDDDARLVGVRDAEGAAQIFTPNLDQIVAVVKGYVGPKVLPNLEKELEELYTRQR